FPASQFRWALRKQLLGPSDVAGLPFALRSIDSLDVRGVLLGVKALRDPQDAEAEDGHHGEHAERADGDERRRGRVSPNVFPQFFPRAARPGLDRLVAEPAFEIVGKCGGRGVALFGEFPQALEADRFQIAIDAAANRQWPGRIVLQNFLERLVRRRAREWRT